ncbi:MAG: DUF378 domain-containing protein [Candidatus Paceibacterota bacterium]|jgi:hypothetical protein
MKSLHMIAWILLVVGGLNWLLVAFNFNLVSLIFGSIPWLENLVYILVGLSAIYEVATHKKSCKACDKAMAAPVQ